jgi:hypothetical protein
VTLVAHNSSGIEATATGTINLTTAAATTFQMTGPTSTPVNQVLNADNTLSQAITVMVTSTTPASGVNLQWKLADGTLSGSKVMAASGGNWTYTIPAGTGPFVPGNVLFTMTGTPAAGGPTASTTSTVTLAATSLGAISIANVSWAPSVCVATADNTMFRATDFAVEVKNVASNDQVTVSFQSLGFFPTTSTSDKKLGPNGGLVFSVSLASGTVAAGPSFDFFVTVRRAADSSTSTPYYKTVPVTTVVKKQDCA